MAHGKPDWGLVGPKWTTYGLDDLGEAVVRLGSPVVWDRRGDVVFMDDYEHGTGQAFFNFGGAGAGVFLSCDHAWHGAYCIRTVASPEPNNSTRIEYNLPLPVLGKVGFEFWFSMMPEIETLELHVQVWDGDYVMNFRVDYNPTTNELRIRNNVPAWVVLDTDADLFLTNDAMHCLKMVVDLEDAGYVRVILDDNRYEPIAEAATRNVSALFGRMHLLFTTRAIPTQTAVVFFDNLIVTQNEP